MRSTPRTGIDGLAGDLELQREIVRARAPSYDAILAELGALLGSDPALGRRLADALRGRSFVARYDRPLLILAALRHEALRLGAAHPLHRAIAARPPAAEAVSRDAVAAAFAEEHAELYRLLATRYVQTNETLRAVTWRWPAALAGAGGGARPLALVDVGASAGLNLVADALPAAWTDAHGERLEVAEDVRAPLRLGLDARPLDASDPAVAAWLRACVWPGDEARMARLDAALSAWRRAPAVVERADVRDAPARIAAVVEEAGEDSLVLAYQTVVREYLPADVARAYQEAMRARIEETPRGRLAFLELETAATPDPVRPASIVAHVRGPAGVESLELARCHWHPTSLAVDRAAAERFSRLVGR